MQMSGAALCFECMWLLCLSGFMMLFSCLSLVVVNPPPVVLHGPQVPTCLLMDSEGSTNADRKWGSAYLTRDFFTELGATMGDRVLLVVAYDESYSDEKPVAGALNLIGSEALFGRNWGCKFGDRYKHLHFELCYYQAIEAAIELRLQRVEAGAQVCYSSLWLCALNALHSNCEVLT